MSMTTNGIALIMLFILAAATGGLIVALSALIGRRKAPPERETTYECGLDPVGTPRRPFSVTFFLVAVIFIVLEVEIVFLYPWALVFRDAIADGVGMVYLIELAVFMGIVAIALTYVWGRGALEWEDS